MRKISLFKKLSSQHSRIFIYALAFLVIGGLLLAITKATSPSVSVEPEKGANSGATVGGDFNASGFQYVQFGSQAPDTFVFNAENMMKAKTNKTTAQQNSYKYLISKANAFLSATPHSVMDKTETPPSGSKHDYMSQGPYLWPDPSKSNGLPYIYKDGQVNPEYYDIPDQQNLADLYTKANVLSLAYFYTNDTRYSDKAAQLISAWFIDPATKMNPNVNYGQRWPGVRTGSPSGIIEFSEMYVLIDSIQIIKNTPSWKDSDQTAMKNWLNSFVDWLQTSSIGKSESGSKNNHGSCYNTIIASFSEFVGDHAQAKSYINKSKTLINNQIEANGTQPLELDRTHPWNYSNLNLKAHTSMATIADREGINLWDYTNPSGGSIKKALDYLRKFAISPSGKTDWQKAQPQETAANWNPFQLTVALRQSANGYNNPQYVTDANTSLERTANSDWSSLEY